MPLVTPVPAPLPAASPALGPAPSPVPAASPSGGSKFPLLVGGVVVLAGGAVVLAGGAWFALRGPSVGSIELAPTDDVALVVGSEATGYDLRPVRAPAASAPYTPDEMAQAAYDKAKATGADAKPNPKHGDATAIAAGKAQYDAKCVVCHGATGMGDGVASQALPQKPANFHWKERWDATPTGTKHWILLNGIQGSGMAPLGLTEDQAWEVLAYIDAEFASNP